MTPVTNTGESTYYLLETASGRFLDLENPNPDDICLEDVAQGLATTTRFRGQTGFLSVAEHAVLVADKLEAMGAATITVLAGLHHDDHEAFLGDVPTPLKKLLGPVWKELEARMDEAIVEALGLPFRPYFLAYPQVKEIDTWSLIFEASRRLPSGGRGWGVTTDIPLELNGIPWTGGLEPKPAAALWLKRHQYFVNQLGGVTP